jgi:hypothetical protein
VQLDEPASAAYVPATHGEHDVAPASEAYWPERQTAQLVAATAAAYDPAAQRVHATELVPPDAGP